jgi:mRNA-degrading endonuclease toxin of MazEF toxin-antitoxin module
MGFPEPQLGLVVSYAYLWHHEHRAGREEGRKDRPCVILLAVERAANGITFVQVAPITHAPPNDAAAAVELPPAVKRHLGLDEARSWVVLNEVNEFAWPGFDLRPVPGLAGTVSYGFLPPRLFDLLISKLTGLWRAGRGKTTPRD